ncbi:MAG: hypothetical protein CXZ00_00760 [Acidobacteria bacterium]|nr:MAG: hypothetical protein CXZ00_00760 [Acidobacteriota bacterium]
MKCTEFDVLIDEMLSGILHPDANQHMRLCERCTSHYRARVSVQNSLRDLSAATPPGPSSATDRAVMERYRRLQRERGAAAAKPAPVTPTARQLKFPRRSLAPLWTSRMWLSGAAAVVFAVCGSAVHLWTGASSVSAPTVASVAPPSPMSSPQQSSPVSVPENSRRAVDSNSRHYLQRPSRILSKHASTQPQLASVPANRTRSSAEPVLTAKAVLKNPAVVFREDTGYNAMPTTRTYSNTAPVIRLASTGSANSVAQSASSTWAGYSNLMYCDPLTCSGPMQVVRIKVPVGRVRPNLGQSIGNAFVNADVVVGPDGVARAIRVAN